MSLNVAFKEHMTLFRNIGRTSLGVILWGFVVSSPIGAQPAPVALNPLHAPLPKACLDARYLKGRDTAYAYLPCNSLDVLEPEFRKGVECTLARAKKGGWAPKVFETYRSNARQRTLYSYGRTRPGSRVTNAPSAITTVHHYGLAVDVIHAVKGWDHPRFFYWLGQHAEACGLVAGAFWTRFKDAPHLQTGKWPGAPPQWARTLVAKDSLSAVWTRIYAP